MSTNENKQKWTLKKEISYGQMITVVTIAVAALAFTIRLEGRIDLNVEAINDNSQHIKRVDVRVSRTDARTSIEYREIIRRLERISDKLDSKADK